MELAGLVELAGLAELDELRHRQRDTTQFHLRKVTGFDGSL